MTVCAMSDYSFNCTVYIGNEQVESYSVPRPEYSNPEYHGETPPPDCNSVDGMPDSACIFCTTDDGVVCVAAAWVMHAGRHYKTYVRSVFLLEDSTSNGALESEEVFHERPRSSLHTVSSLSIQCDASKHRLCLVGSVPSSQSPQKHVTAIEVIRMRKYGLPPTSPPTCKIVHCLSSQMRDDISALQSDLRSVLDQRAKAVPRSGELHSAGGSGTLSSVFVQFLRQSQWWQVCELRALTLPSLFV